jgi:hypothetical protein
MKYVAVVVVAALALVGCGGSGGALNRSASSFISTSDPFANGGYYEVWDFIPSHSGTATFRMTSPDFDPYLALQDENDDVITEDDNSGPGDDAEVRAFLVEGRVYHLIATTAFANDTGQYTVFWQDWVDLDQGPSVARTAKPLTRVAPARSKG